MKFLVDECLHTSLVSIAHESDHACDHVNFIGLSGYKDWQLMSRVRANDCTFVTNNRADFKLLYAQEQVHAGLIIIVPNVLPSLQRELFRAGLAHIGDCELVNTLLEIELVGNDNYLPRVSLSGEVGICQRSFILLEEGIGFPHCYVANRLGKATDQLVFHCSF
jgi:predicted nuclease of predicted toxin-antitoxin system